MGNTTCSYAPSSADIIGTKTTPGPSVEELSVVQDRRLPILLTKTKTQLLELSASLKSSQKYFSRSDRDLMATVLARSKLDYSAELRARYSPTSSLIEGNSRLRICDGIIRIIDLCSEEMYAFAPIDDDERIDLLVLDGRATHECLAAFHEMGVVCSHVLRRSRRFKLVGMSSCDEFYEGTRSRWGFTNPEQYFLYSGGATMPWGQLD
jgi:hypothetical protein